MIVKNIFHKKYLLLLLLVLFLISIITFSGIKKIKMNGISSLLEKIPFTSNASEKIQNLEKIWCKGEIQLTGFLRLDSKNSKILTNIEECTLFLKEEKIQFKNSLLYFKNLTGILGIYPNRTLILSGKAENVKLDDVEISPKKLSKNVFVQGNCIAKWVNASNVEGNIILKTSGNLQTSKAYITLENDTIILTDFSGKISKEKNFKFEGMVKSIEVKGKERIIVE